MSSKVREYSQTTEFDNYREIMSRVEPYEARLVRTCLPSLEAHGSTPKN